MTGINNKLYLLFPSSLILPPLGPPLKLPFSPTCLSLGSVAVYRWLMELDGRFPVKEIQLHPPT